MPPRRLEPRGARPPRGAAHESIEGRSYRLGVATRAEQAQGEMRSPEDLKTAIIEGAVDRVRPKLMTVATTLIGLLPVMYGTETGSQVMKRIAAPMVGGLISSTFLTLVIIPVVYDIWKRWELKRAEREEYSKV